MPKQNQQTNEKAIVAASSKGGAGKSTISTILGAFSPNASAVLFQLDSHNQLTSFNNSTKIINGQTFKAKGKDLEAGATAIGRALFGQNESSVVIDVGGSDDCVEAMKTLTKDDIDFDIYVPITPDAETLINALTTVQNLPANTKKYLVFNNFVNLQEDFWFIFGDTDYGIVPDFSIFEHFDFTIEIPRSRLFGISKQFQTTVWDFSELKDQYDFNTKRKELAKTQDNSFELFMSSHRLSTDCAEYLSSIKSSIKKVSEWKI